MVSKDWKAISKICHIAFIILSLETVIIHFSQTAYSAFSGIFHDYYYQSFSLILTRAQGPLIFLFFLTGVVTKKAATSVTIEEYCASKAQTELA
jgi:hypothetical protein